MSASERDPVRKARLPRLARKLGERHCVNTLAIAQAVYPGQVASLHAPLAPVEVGYAAPAVTYYPALPGSVFWKSPATASPSHAFPVRAEFCRSAVGSRVSATGRHLTIGCEVDRNIVRNTY